MKQPAIVIASYGVSLPGGAAGIPAVERALAAAAPGLTCVRAFTSPAVRSSLAARGSDVPGLSESLARLRADGVRRVLVQPTHLLCGFGYDQLLAEAKVLASGFDMLATGRPLLAGPEALKCFAGRLSAAFPAVRGEALVFVGHGTAHTAGAAYPALQAALLAAGRRDLFVGVLQGQPGFREVLRGLEAYAPVGVRLLPLMLSAGRHTRQDLAAGWQPRLEQAGYQTACSFTGLGEYPWVQKLYQEHLLHALCTI